MGDEHICIMRDRIGALETGQAETRIYVKEIREDIQEIKADLKTMKPQTVQPVMPASQDTKKEDSSKLWQPVVLKLIEVMGIAFTVLAAIVGVAKLLGKG